jgi:tetratricopeptide (TPR) repeat protein
MQLKGDQLPLGDSRGRFRPWRILVLLALIGGGILFAQMVQRRQIKPLFLPTDTPTRTPLSYQQQAEAFFSAGDLGSSIAAYRQAVLLAPLDAALWAELARVQTYSSALLTTAEEQRSRMEQARQSIDQAVAADEDLARAWAIRILVYDWSAGLELDDPAERERLLLEAGNSAVTAARLDPNDPLAVAFNAELLVDQERFEPALQQAELALDLEPNSLDVHRVYGTVLESNGYYDDAIQAYERALEINPNLTFLYLRIGSNHRRQGRTDQALEAFDRAATINAQLGIQDPVPYLAIGRTYLQSGEFFIAARNLESAVRIAPNDPNLLGFLGIIYFKARNYEFASTALYCAVHSCTLGEQALALCEAEEAGPPATPSLRIAQSLQSLSILDCSLAEPDPRLQGVRPMALESSTLEYFYTYASVLAFLNLCEDAEQVFVQLQASYGTDPIVASIIAEGRSLCSASAAPTPQNTP